MNKNAPRIFSMPRLLQIGHPPYRHGEASIVLVAAVFLLAALPAVLSGLFLFGWDTIRITAICVATALIADAGYNLLVDRNGTHFEIHAFVIGVLLACTFPPQVHWSVPVTAVSVAVVVGQGLSGGVGNYLWHPVALGRVLAQIIFPGQMAPEQWPVLARGNLFVGNLSLSKTLPTLSSWHTETISNGAEAWQVSRPIDLLRGSLHGSAGESSQQVLGEFVRDMLPPWPDLLTGVAGGCVGTACVAVLLLGGLFLLWRGYLRGTMIITALLTVTVLSAILPLSIHFEGSYTTRYWLPILAAYKGLPVGLVYVGYQVIAGDLLFVLLLLASDPTSSPLTSRGHAVFGFLIAATTMIFRLMVGLPAAAFWALLIANTLVPVINYFTRRRILGT